MTAWRLPDPIATRNFLGRRSRDSADTLKRVRDSRSRAWYLGRSANFAGAFTLGIGGESVNLYQLVIGIGAWLGTIMLFNVWVLIWPSQKKVLGLVPATDEQKAAARKTTLYATRANFILSVSVLLCMGSAGHGLPF